MKQRTHIQKKIFLYKLLVFGFTADEISGNIDRRLSACLLLISAEYSNYATHMKQVAHGFTAGKEITDGVAKVLEEGSWKKIEKIARNVAPFLGAAGAVFEIVGLFGNSPEVEKLDEVIGMLNEGFNRMEERFDRIEKRFEDIEDLIREQHFWTRLRKPMADLLNVQNLVDRYFLVTDPDDREQRRKDLEDEYKTVLDAINEIKKTFEGALVDPPLCKALTDFSKVNRRTVLFVSTDLFNRMIKGAGNFILIGKTLNRTDNDHDEREMVALIQEISEMIEACDESIEKEEWKKEWLTDLNDALVIKKTGISMRICMHM